MVSQLRNLFLFKLLCNSYSCRNPQAIYFFYPTHCTHMFLKSHYYHSYPALDGSGPPGEAKKQPAAAGRTALQPATAAPSSSSPAPVPSTTTPKAYLRFTTQSTIKPACAGCGYVELTSPKTPPANQPTKFDLQTPPFKNEVEPAAPPAAGFGGSPGAGAPYGRGGESGSGYGPESGGNPPQGAYPGQGFGGPAQNLENQG